MTHQSLNPNFLSLLSLFSKVFFFFFVFFTRRRFRFDLVALREVMKTFVRKSEMFRL